MLFMRKIQVETEVKYLFADMEPRYWEDSSVNGKGESGDEPTIPLRDGVRWTLKIDLDTGQICDWPEGTSADTYYKVCDQGVYSLLAENGDVIATRSGYVPDMLSPLEKGYGDYVILNIDGAGRIAGWKADLSYFERIA